MDARHLAHTSILLVLISVVRCISVIEQPKSSTIVEGDLAAFHCEITNYQPWQAIVWHGKYDYNPTEFGWHIDAEQTTFVNVGDITSVPEEHGTPLLAYELKDDGTKRCSFGIFNASLYDQGTYICGYYDNRIDIGDRNLYTTEITTITTRAELTVLSRPTCSYKPVPFHFDKSDKSRSITLTCEITDDDSNPTLTWYRNERSISSGSRATNSYSYDLSLSDNGISFSCVASAPPSLEDPWDRSCEVTPFKQASIEPSRERILAGNNATFTCSAQGLPIESISWVTRGNSNPSTRVIENTNSLSRFKIVDAQLEHSETEIICEVGLFGGDVVNATATLIVYKASANISNLALAVVIPVVLIVLLILITLCCCRKCCNSKNSAPSSRSPQNVPSISKGVDNQAVVLKEDSHDPQNVDVTVNVTFNVLNVNTGSYEPESGPQNLYESSILPNRNRGPSKAKALGYQAKDQKTQGSYEPERGPENRYESSILPNRNRGPSKGRALGYQAKDQKTQVLPYRGRNDHSGATITELSADNRPQTPDRLCKVNNINVVDNIQEL